MFLLVRICAPHTHMLRVLTYIAAGEGTSGAQSVPRKYPLHHYTTTSSSSSSHISHILTLPSECCSGNHDSSHQAMFFQSSVVQFMSS